MYKNISVILWAVFFLVLFFIGWMEIYSVISNPSSIGEYFGEIANGFNENK
jgi:hypothetical protein